MLLFSKPVQGFESRDSRHEEFTRFCVNAVRILHRLPLMQCLEGLYVIFVRSQTCTAIRVQWYDTINRLTELAAEVRRHDIK